MGSNADVDYTMERHQVDAVESNADVDQTIERHQVDELEETVLL